MLEATPNALVQLQAQYNHCGEAASDIAAKPHPKSACLLQRLLDGARVDFSRLVEGTAPLASDNDAADVRAV